MQGIGERRDTKCSLSTITLADTLSQLDIMYLHGVAILVMPNKRNNSNGGDMLLRHQ